jgi:hypothetical protein
MTEAKTTAPGRAAAIGFGTVDLISAVLVYLGVFEGLPARYWLVDGGAALVIALFAGAGFGLLTDAPWASRAALASSVVALVLGLALVSTLALTASYLSGVYGPVGKGGALILGLVAAMALPYLVAIPLAQLAWLGRRWPSDSSRRPPAAPVTASGS